jgi:7-carboxy-7-deazaguanine synthase
MRQRPDTESAAGVDVKRTPDKGWVSEMFCSVQGEGLFLGERQLFFRMAGCSATCYWCDTVASKTEQPFCTIHGKTKKSLANPLEQPDFVVEIARAVGENGMRVYLETSGLEVDAFARVRPHVDVVSMDVKLPYATGEDHWEAHREFLKWLVGRTAFVKIVVDASTPFREIETAVHLIAEVDRGFPLVFQPESMTYLKGKGGRDARTRLSSLLDEAQRLALLSLEDVRVIPQCHRIMGIR